MEEEKKKVKQIIDAGGKVIDTIIYEKDKNTITRKIEPVNGEPTSSTTIQTKDSINLQTSMNHHHF